MRLLLDTHVVIWAIVGSRALIPRIREMLEDTSNDLIVSSVTLMEILNKHRLGKLSEGEEVVNGLDGYLRRLDATLLSLNAQHARLAGTIVSPHRDPFDRFIAAQSILEGIALVSRDRAFPRLGVRPIW